MFTIRREQVEALARESTRRARGQWLASLRARGFAAHENVAAGRVVIEDPGGGRAAFEPEAGGVAVTSGEGRTHHFEFDRTRSLRAVTDPAGLRIAFAYDGAERLVRVDRGGLGSFEFSYDEAGHLSRLQYPDASAATFFYNAAGRLSRTVDRNGHARSFEYAPHGPLQRITDARGATAAYEYDGQDELKAFVPAAGGRHTFRINQESGSATVYHDGRAMLRLAVNPDTGTQDVEYADGTRARFVFEADRIVSAANETCTVHLSYDAHGLVESEEADGRVVRYERSAAGALRAVITPDGERISFERDSEHRLRAVRDASGRVFEVGYELSGALAAVTYPNGVRVERRSTPLGLPEALVVGSPGRPGSLLQAHWSYDLCDRVTAEVVAGGPEREFGYDAEGRLVRVYSASPELRESYTLDSNGNAVAANGRDCVVNALDQLERVGITRFHYDWQGNMTRGSGPGGRVECAYNGRGQLIEVRGESGITRYAYDPFGRRVRKERGDEVTRYNWAGHLLLSEVTEGDGPTTRRDFVIAPDFGIALAQRVDGAMYYLHHGRRLEPLVMTDEAGEAVWKASYTAFGEARVEIERVTQPFRLLGQYHDPETGLHYNVARYYNPRLGRFLQRDPLGYGGRSWNEYLYGDGDPLNRSDPTGEILPILVAGAALGAGIGAGVEIYRQKRANPNAPLDWGKVGKEALSGGAVGTIGAAVGALLAPAATALGTGLAAAAGGGAIVGSISAAVETCADAALHGHAPDASTLTHSMLWGGIIGMFSAGIGGALARRARRAAPKGRLASPLEQPPTTTKIQRSIDDPVSLTGATEDEVRQAIPEGWVESETNRPGRRFQDPRTKGADTVRMMPGNSNAPPDKPIKHGPYLRVTRGGKPHPDPIPLKGNPTLPQ